MIAATTVAREQQSAPTPFDAAAALLGWYDHAHRQLPWRFAPGKRANAYHVWLSEIMLQQTTVKSVIPYFNRFIERWPTLRKLAAADLDDVLAAWAGLGYYSRARNMHACARVIMEKHRGRFPRTEAKLRGLPGIGPYTAAAIAAIAFGARTTPVDGNIERVVSRLFAVEDPLPAAKPELRRLAATLTPDARAGDFAQALMDLGATICTPRRPSCLVCPLAPACEAQQLGIAASLPARMEKADRPVRRGVAFVALREDGHVLLRRRPPAGLLGGMLEVPSSEWTEKPPADEAALRAAPVTASWWSVPGLVQHTFTHFRLELTVYRTIVPVETALDLWAEPARCRWVHRSELAGEALPSIMHKVIAHALRA